MSQSNAYRVPTQSVGSPADYKPPYSADPQPRQQRQLAILYPGMQYQMYPAALSDRALRRRPTREVARSRKTLLGLGAVGLVAAFVLGLRLLDYDAPASHGTQATPVRSAVLSVSPVDTANTVDDLQPLQPASSLSLTRERVRAAVSPGNLNPDIAEAPGRAAASTSLKARETPGAATVPADSAALNGLARQPPPSVALNIPDTPVAVAAPMVVASGSRLADSADAARTGSAYQKPASTPAACTEALRAMQLCGELARDRK